MKRILLATVALIGLSGVAMANRPVISAECLRMSDGRELVMETDEVVEQATDLGYHHKVCGLHYDIKKFTNTSLDENGNQKGVCLLQLKKQYQLTNGVCSNSKPKDLVGPDSYYW